MSDEIVPGMIAAVRLSLIISRLMAGESLSLKHYQMNLVLQNVP